MTNLDGFRSVSVVASLIGLACALAGCGDSAMSADAAVDVARDAGSDTGSDAAAPIYLLTVQGALRASAADAGAADAGAADAGFNPEYGRTAHNGVVSGIMGLAMSAGDVTHHIGLGQSDPSQFLALDTWNSLSGLTSTLANPGFQSAFGSLFTAAPTIGVWLPAQGYLTYIQPATAPTRIVLMVRGTLRSPGDMARATHNGVVTASMAAATAAGDVSHTVWLSQSDPAQFLAVDVWTNAAGVMGFLSDPQVAGALGSLFTAAPSLTLYTPPTGWTVYGMNPAWGTL